MGSHQMNLEGDLKKIRLDKNGLPIVNGEEMKATGDQGHKDHDDDDHSGH